MADYYNINGMMNSTSMFGVTESINSASGGIFSIVFFIISALVILFLMRGYEFKIQLLSALGFIFIESILFWGLGFIPMSWVVMILGFIVMNTIWVMWT